MKVKMAHAMMKARISRMPALRASGILERQKPLEQAARAGARSQHWKSWHVVKRKAAFGQAQRACQQTEGGSLSACAWLRPS